MPKFILSCGAKKRDQISYAINLYTGSFFIAQKNWALKKASSKNDIFILSAKHGLISHDKIIAPYDLKMGNKGCVSVDFVKIQAKKMGLIDEIIVSPAGENYRKIISSVFKNSVFPFKNCKGLGFIIKGLKEDEYSY